MQIETNGQYLETKTIQSKKGETFYISKVLLEEECEIAEVFSTRAPSFLKGDYVEIRINADLGTKKVSANFAGPKQ